jgi:hypothetical protein
MSYYGDFAAGDIIDLKFTSRDSTGIPYTLAGSPAVAVYKSNSTTESTAGVTLTVDFDSRTGLNHVRIDTTADGSFYADGSQFMVVVTAGTVNGVSVVGEAVGRLTLRSQASLYPTTAGRKLDVSAGGEAGLDWANIGSPTTTNNLSGTSTKAVEPTVAGRTLDISTGGEAGLDWANIGSPTTTVNLSGTSTKAVEPTVAGRTLDVSTGGEAGLDWANIGSPTTTVNLSGTTVGVVTSASIAAGQLFVKKNSALTNFEFLMTDSTNHAPVTGKTVSGTISKDGGAFAALTNSVAEVGNGIYKIDLTSGETNATMFTLRFTATGSDDALISIITQA